MTERMPIRVGPLQRHIYPYSVAVDDLLTRTKQIIVDQDTGARLKEPRSLYSIGNYGQEAKFPNHVQVALDTPDTLNCEPETHNEPLYENRGDEPKPEPRATLSQCVYYNDPGPDNYFMRSRARGKKPVNLPVPTGADTLHFESRFESGNLLRASKVGEFEYELELRTDLYTNRHTQWFYFQIKNIRPDVNYRFTIINFSKPSSLYNNGLRPLMYSTHLAETRGKGWIRNGENIRYYRRAIPTPSGRSQYCLTWTMKFPHNDDTVYLAHDYPYTYTDLQQYLDTLTNDTSKSRFIKTRILCRSLAQNFVHILTITNPHETLEAKQKKVVVISARVHPGETNGSWMMKGFLDFITSMDPDAVTLRGHFIFKVIPMLNPDGVIVGNYRCSLAGRDLNRRYKTTLREAFPAIYALTRNVQIFQKEHEVAFYIDLHGHSRKHNVFMYGCQSVEQPGLEKVFPYMMSLNAPGIFKFESCKYKTQANKEGTGRVFMHRLGVKNSFTMEASFGGSTLGSRAGTHLGIKDLERMGRHICDTLLDFYDPDPAKIQYCQDEISQKLREKLIARYGEDQIPKDPQLLHDFESDTSGSNSSSDEGLPAHLAEEHQKRKTKWKKRQPKKSDAKRLDRSQRAKSAEDASKLLKNVKVRPPRPTPSSTSNGHNRSDAEFHSTSTKKSVGDVSATTKTIDFERLHNFARSAPQPSTTARPVPSQTHEQKLHQRVRYKHIPPFKKPSSHDDDGDYDGDKPGYQEAVRVAEAVCYSRSSSDQSVRREADRSHHHTASADYDPHTPAKHALSHLDRFHDPFHARYRRREGSKSKAAQLALALKTYPVTEEEILYSNVMLKQSKLPSIARYPNFGFPRIKD
ncbi:Oidioi.mRNA.OKI2018_I69.XSR.g14474.t1.cds [Oikopleura dioica]|uniref:Oidioi.mRNA.OKI2018_I69.XSR.g14474.t1.cds n=1 Tax=Oikopleura dioica TaxID=34765 RepID=A0ABN7SDW6_OIKDI|nr:Oidioi.mRNA.OKI2018_I69.XSR.g14474.t1.cds [Oikopleura dioica]